MAYQVGKYDEAAGIFLRFPIAAMTDVTTGYAYLAVAKAGRLSDWINHVRAHQNFPGRRGVLLSALAERNLKGRFDGAVRLYRAARRRGWGTADRAGKPVSQ